MKYLVIGDASSMHIYNFVKSVLLPAGYDVHLLTLSNLPVRDTFREFYRESGVVVHSIAEKGYKGLDKTDRLHRVLNICRKLRLMKGIKNVDVCHVHSVYKTSMVMVLQNRRKYKHLILSFWGGDVEDTSPSVINLRQKAIKLADIITVTTEQMLNDVRKIHGEGFRDKLRISRFATDGINCIHRLHKTTTRRECRRSYNIPDDKICITCGYSAYKEQHQDKCLEIINSLPNDIRKKICVIIPMQYGRFDMTYVNKVSEMADACDFQCEVLHEYVPFEKSAMLAIATDIYLHLRDTDAFSNALKEHVYAGSTVITGTWLKYLELERMRAPIKSISDFDELGNMLTEIISSYTISSEIELFSPMYEMYSAESINEQWMQTIGLALDK